VSERSYAVWQDWFRAQSLPLAWIDLDALDQNIQALCKRAGKLPIRIATKSIRVRSVLDYLLAASPQIQGLMTYSAAETAWLAEAGFDDLLLAYPSTDAVALRRIAAQIRKGKTIRLMIDSLAHAERLETLGASENCIFNLCLDIDMSVDYPGLHFGVWRSPLTQAEQVKALAQEILKRPHLELDACMGYEAQIAGVGDAQKGLGAKNFVIRKLKAQSIPTLQARRAAVKNALETLGIELKLFNGGGTGSLESTVQDPSVTEVTVGSGFYAPGLFDLYADFKHQPAAGFALPLVRIPVPGMITCFSGGYIASGSIGKEKLPLPFSPPGLHLLENEGAGEVQTPLRYSGPEKLQPGDAIVFRHAKAGELMERFNQVGLYRSTGKIKDVPSYRGEGQCFG